jgi:hypothetical protein
MRRPVLLVKETRRHKNDQSKVFWHITLNRIGGVMLSVLITSAVDRGFEPLSGLTNDYIPGICCFSSKHVTFSSKSKDWLMSEWSDLSTGELLFQWAGTIATNIIKRVDLNTKRTSLSSHRNVTCYRHDIAA